MRAATPSYINRWAEGREYLRLSRDASRDGRYEEAIKWLHEAHNLGRDNVLIHAVTHFRYVGFSWRESDYRRAFGHFFWALTSPFMVPIERRKRTAVIGDWTPAPRKIAG
jgi:hypothetical protein